MKITRQRLKEIIREELVTERVATVPQVQQMAAAAGVRLSYGDAKTLAARTAAERGALMRLQQALKDGSWRRMTEELGDKEWAPYKLKDEDGPFVLSIPSKDPHERYFRILGRDEGGSPHPHFGPRDAAHEYTSIDKAMSRQWWLKSYGAGEPDIEAVNAPALEELRAPFPAGSRVKHEDYGEGRVTHAGTKNTNVAVLFDKKGRDGKKSRQVSRGSLKRVE